MTVGSQSPIPGSGAPAAGKVLLLEIQTTKLHPTAHSESETLGVGPSLFEQDFQVILTYTLTTTGLG